MVTQHTKCIRLVILSSVASPAVPYLSTLFHKRHDFRGEKSYWIYNVGFDFVSNISILRRIRRGIFINVNNIGLHVKYPLFFSDLQLKLEFSRQIFENTSSFMIIRLVGAELFRWDGRTDTTKLTVALSNFANVPNKGKAVMNFSCLSRYQSAVLFVATS